MAGARNNPAEPTGTVHSGMDLHVHVCGRDEQISTNYGIKDEVRRERRPRLMQPQSSTLGECEGFNSVRTGGRNARGIRAAEQQRAVMGPQWNHVRPISYSRSLFPTKGL